MEATEYGRTSITISCVVRNMWTKQIITAVEKLVFVKVDENGCPIPHGKVHPIDREFACSETLVGE
jgi:acyl-CoA hydrolase